jgi:hypothetical protein
MPAIVNALCICAETCSITSNRHAQQDQELATKTGMLLDAQLYTQHITAAEIAAVLARRGLLQSFQTTERYRWQTSEKSMAKFKTKCFFPLE